MIRRLFVVVVAVLLSPAAAGVVRASDTAGVRDSLKQRYAVSRIELQNKQTQNLVVKQGTVLTLQVDAVPAKSARYVQANSKSPRFHVRDYARLEIVKGKAAVPGPGDFTLPKGTRLVVLDMKHTAHPVTAADGKPAYGCTEFVFRFDPAVLQRSETTEVQHAIDQWLVAA